MDGDDTSGREEDGEKTVFSPSAIIAYTFRLVSVMVLFSMLTTVDSDAPSTRGSFGGGVASGLRQIPIVYLFVPVWMVVILSVAAGVYTNIVHDDLLLRKAGDKKLAVDVIRLKLLKIFGGLLVLAFTAMVS